jgi:Homeodomain
MKDRTNRTRKSQC